MSETYEAKCPECGKICEVDEWDYMEESEDAGDKERDFLPFYCVDCNLSFNRD
jgi:hypothetical protein